MKVRRKFNLTQVGKSFESLDIEVETSTIESAIQEIELCWRSYKEAIKAGLIE
jgi:hypothetical protein